MYIYIYIHIYILISIYIQIYIIYTYTYIYKISRETRKDSGKKYIIESSFVPESLTLSQIVLLLLSEKSFFPFSLLRTLFLSQLSLN